MRVTLLTNIPTPYRAPLYSAIDSQLRTSGGGLSVVYGAQGAPDRQWATEAPLGTAPSFLVPRAFVRMKGRQMYVNPRAAAVVSRTRPDVVVLGGFAPWNYAAAAWALMQRVPFLIWSGETPRSAEHGRGRTLSRAPLIRFASGFLAYGPDAAEYLRQIGARSCLIQTVGNGIDVDAFALAVERRRPQRGEIRSRFGLSGRTVLSVGGKNLDVLARAVDRSRRTEQVLVVGSPTVDEAIPGLVNLGRIPAEEMPSVYAAADCLVHTPWIDRWPHAINEALSAGIPVVATAKTGAPDDVFTGPGCCVAERDPNALADAIDAALELSVPTSPELREAVRNPLRRWSTPAMAERFIAGARAAMSR
jgi:glycosyltransferase involved in cell wall biosynthesis